ncbi:MAG: hypothetical protein ACK6DR_10740 [Gemmatimonas sp.]|jgi:hypothetical protein|uniref:hypothetical protein n=1 Tax=Gemmatimonas sp. TaxID=1962908 RepID=UPI0022CB27C8|nr:hypothetical protein [Gemmatimonas sp.]MCA2984487.1 hypothetical protein [Gemmatimonas sp.]MCA2986369.1 hypothetical protein [Gemmatimonas sp.]MCA2993539.1 hypothetical protein [Gemmatimonas sp.]MCE2954254.1 hypothetical protein [Gemmatimonas sp.]MCZ8011548.1 hypothetical protein [Gemmatimonas sp.]
MYVRSLPAALVGLVTMVSSLAAQPTPAVTEQLAAAVLPLPKEMRDGAGVMGYRTAGKLELLRPVKNGMLCLADDPAEEQFHVSCYADTMEPFMARGRALRAQGVKGAQVDTVRFAEVKGGKIKMPTAPAALYQIFAQSYDAATGTVKGGRTLFVVYVPFATAATTGLSTVPSDSKPWLMLPGTPKAHIMFSASM